MIDAAGQAERARIQLPPGRPGNAADHAAPQVRSVDLLEHALDGTLDADRSRVGPARGAGRRARRRRLSRRAAQGRRDRRTRAGHRRRTPGRARVPRRHRACGDARRRQRRPRAVRDGARRSVRQAQRAAYAAVARDPLRRHAVPHATSATARSRRARRDDDRHRRAARVYFTGLQQRIVARWKRSTAAVSRDDGRAPKAAAASRG